MKPRLDNLVDEIFGESRENGVIIKIGRDGDEPSKDAAEARPDLDRLVDDVFGESRENGVIIKIGRDGSD